jgi:hypothetical protein
MSDPFQLIDPPADKDQFLKLSYLACQCRENSITLLCIGGWILPTTPLPWTPERATALRRTLHHVERCRGTLQANVACFTAMTRTEAERWVEDLHRHHGSGAWPCWWSASVRSVAECIRRLARGAA